METQVSQMGASGGESQRVILSLCVCKGEGSSPRARNVPEASSSSKSWHLHEAPQIDHCNTDEVVSPGKWHVQGQTGPPKKTQDNLTVPSPRRAGVEAKSNQASQFQVQVDPGGAEALPDQGPLKASLDPCSLAARPGELLVMPCYLTR